MNTYNEIRLAFETRAENRQRDLHGRTTLNDFVSQGYVGYAFLPHKV